MRRQLAAALGLLASVSLAACVGPVSPAGTDTVDARYASSGGSFDTGGAIIVMLSARERDGQLVICGARTGTRQSAVSLPHEHKVLNAGLVQMGGRTVLQGVRSFPQHDYARDLTGAEARCFETSTAWRPDFAEITPRARFVRMGFDWDEFRGYTTVFRSTEVPDPIARN